MCTAMHLYSYIAFLYDRKHLVSVHTFQHSLRAGRACARGYMFAHMSNTNTSLYTSFSILSVLAAHREKTGIDLRARIGIGAGEVISGVMGRLQPRFCVYGEAMKEAAHHERHGLPDTLHCSREFFDAITGDSCSGACRAGLQHKLEGIRLVNRLVNEGTLRVCSR